MSYVHGRTPQDADQEGFLSDSEVEDLRGRGRWNCCGITTAVFALYFVGDFVLRRCHVENVKAEHALNNTYGTSSHEEEHSEATQDEVMIGNPQERMQRTLICSALSLQFAIALLWYLQKMERTQAPIRASLLTKFMLKGAFLATTLAFIVQMCLLYLAAFLWSSTSFGARHVDRAAKMSELPLPNFILACVFEGVMAGFSEEAAKLLAVLMCTEVLPPGAPLYGTLRQFRVCPGCRCRDLVESPAAFVLSAVACGLGFMVMENMEYAAGEAVTPGHKGNPDAIFWIGMGRICFNLHWVLAGLSAVRFVPYFFSKPERPKTFGPATLLAILAAIWPSGCFHAGWDIAVMSFGFQGPGGAEEGEQLHGNSTGSGTAEDSRDGEGASFYTAVQVIYMLASIPALVAYFVCLARGLWIRWPSDESYVAVRDGPGCAAEEAARDRNVCTPDS